MVKTLTETDTSLDTAPVSIATAAEAFMRSASWVKERKSDLKEIWWWCQDELFTPDGSLTQKGFERLGELYRRTANSEIVSKGGKRRSVRKTPEMSIEDYKIFIWTSHKKFPPNEGLSDSSGVASNPATSQGSSQGQDDDVIVLEFLETEDESIDEAGEIRDETLALQVLGADAISQQSTDLGFALTSFKEALSAQIEQVIVAGAIEGKQRGLVKAQEILRGDQPATKRTNIKRTKA